VADAGAGVMDSAIAAVPDAGSGGGGGGISPLGVGALGAGAVGLGMLLGGAKPSLPIQYGALENRVPGLWGQAATLYDQGQVLTSDAQRGLAMAQRGELTPEQAAQLKVMTTAEGNKAAQLMASMGRDINKDTTGLSMQQDIDLKALAASQAFIQSTIQLATSEMTAGQNLIGDALNYETAADKILQSAADAQIKADAAASAAMGNMFKAIGAIAITAAGTVVGGPAGFAAGATLGSALMKSS